MSKIEKQLEFEDWISWDDIINNKVEEKKKKFEQFKKNKQRGDYNEHI